MKEKPMFQKIPGYTYILDFNCCYIQNDTTLNFETIKSCDFDSTLLKVKSNNEFQERSISEILKSKYNFFLKAKGIINTSLNPGLNSQILNNSNIRKITFNTFKNASLYKQIKQKDLFPITENLPDIILHTFKVEAPAFTNLITNLFYHETNLVIYNFLCFLHNAIFKCLRQDKCFLFFGFSADKTGQGAGKGLLVNFLSKLIDPQLIGELTNNSYLTPFNLDLINKPLVFFDEANLKNLKYFKIKELTGNEMLRIEQKGHDAFYVKNVISLIMFSNETQLCKDILETDRRLFLINPNPEHLSINKVMIKFGGSDSYLEKLDDEKNIILNLLYHHCNQKVIDPIALPTAAKRRYFERTRDITIDIIINHLELIGSNKKFRSKILEMLNEESYLLGNCNQEKTYLLQKGVLSKDLLYEITEFLCKKNLYKAGLSKNYFWIKAIEKAKDNEITIMQIKLKKTKSFADFKRTIIFDNDSELSISQKKTIKKYLRKCYGRRI
ncbi:MAG: primase-helicase family protein [Sphaerochaeta sp.]